MVLENGKGDGKGFNQLTLSMRKVFLRQVCLQSIPCGLIKMY